MTFKVICVDDSRTDRVRRGQTYTVIAVVDRYYVLAGVSDGYSHRGMLQNRFRHVTDISDLKKLLAVRTMEHA